MRISTSKSIISLALLGALAACDRKDKAPDDVAGGSVVENEVAGLIRYADGTPAADAEVKVYAVGYVPGPEGLPKRAAQGPVFATRTDAQGRYAIDSLPKGEYNILGRKAALYSYRDSLFVSGKPVALAPDTLDAAGTMTGWVALQPNHNRQSVTVQALGTDVYANADAAGRFTLGPLAEGGYTLRVVTTEEKYTPLYASMSVRTGRNDTLADSLRPVFTGIPVVTGLKAVYDTLHAVVTVSWNRTPYPQFQEYQVFRNQRDDLAVATAPLARVTDTVFHDTLFAFGSGGLASGDSAMLHLAYRVKVIDQSDQAGLTFGKAVVDAPSPFFVRAAFVFQVADRRTGIPLLNATASPGDSVRINTAFHDPKRRIVRVAWYLGGGTSPLRSVDVDPPEADGALALFYVTGRPGYDTIRVEATDEAGSRWTGRTIIHVVQDDPIVSPGADTLVARNGMIHLHANARDAFGRIVEYAWDIGKTGTFVPGSGPDTAFAAPAGFDHIPCLVRVTDDDGNASVATRMVDVALEWEQIPASDESGGGGLVGAKAVEFKGKLWLTGGSTKIDPGDVPPQMFLETSSDGVVFKRIVPAQNVPPRIRHGLAVFHDRMWVLGGQELRQLSSSDYWKFLRSDVYNTVDGTNWEVVTLNGFPGGGGSAVVVFHDRLWSIGGAVSPSAPAGVWSSSDGANWTEAVSNAPLPPLAGHQAVVHDGSIFVIGGLDPTTGILSQAVWRSSDGANWEKSSWMPAFGPITDNNALEYGGFMWVLGGNLAKSTEQPIADRLPTRPVWFSQDGIKWQSMDLSPSIFSNGIYAPFRASGTAACVFQDGLWSLFGGEVNAYLYSGAVWRAH